MTLYMYTEVTAQCHDHEHDIIIIKKNITCKYDNPDGQLASIRFDCSCQLSCHFIDKLGLLPFGSGAALGLLLSLVARVSIWSLWPATVVSGECTEPSGMCPCIGGIPCDLFYDIHDCHSLSRVLNENGGRLKR